MMKRKHQGIFTVSIIILSLIIISLSAFRIKDKGEKQMSYIRPKPVSDVFTENPFILQDIRRLKKSLGVIARPPAVQDIDMDLALFGYQEVPGEYSKRDSSGLKDQFDYNLTFVFYSQNKRFCIVNDIFYTEGEKLPDGGKIKKIKSGNILVQKSNTCRWIYMKNPTCYPRTEDVVEDVYNVRER